MLLLGGDSPPLFQKATDLLDSTLPHSQVVVLPDQQHIAMDTDPEMFREGGVAIFGKVNTNDT